MRNKGKSTATSRNNEQQVFSLRIFQSVEFCDRNTALGKCLMLYKRIMKHHWSSFGGQIHLLGDEYGIFPKLKAHRGRGSEREWRSTNHGNNDSRLQGFPNQRAIEHAATAERRRISGNKDRKWREERAREVSGTAQCSYLPPTSCSALSKCGNPWRMKI